MIAKWIAKNEGFNNPDQDFSYVSDFVLMWSYVEKKIVDGFGNKGDSLGCVTFDRYINLLDVASNGHVDEAYQFYAHRYSHGDGVRYFDGLFQRNRERLFKIETFQTIRSHHPNEKDQVRVVAFICSRIRNNLFHGAKDLPMIAEQEDVLSNASIGLKGLAIAFNIAQDDNIVCRES